LLLKLPLLSEEIRGIRDFTLNPRLRTSRCCWTSSSFYFCSLRKLKHHV